MKISIASLMPYDQCLGIDPAHRPGEPVWLFQFESRRPDPQGAPEPIGPRFRCAAAP
ncbi:MAG: hypothetical protein IPN71_11395 [Fibrobacteres bacterium]|nr:hypothetical protein [Fibrobacterota bacterium]